MSIGILKLKLHIPGSFSLKDKRRIVKSLTAKIRQNFNVSIAELGDNELWQVALIGISCISKDSRYINEIISKVIDFISQNHHEVVIIEKEMEILPGP